MENNKQGFLGAALKHVALPLAGGTATAYGYDRFNYGDFPADSPWTKERKGNFFKNLFLSSLSYSGMPGRSAPTKKLLLTTGVSTPMITNMLVEGPGTMAAYRNSQKNIFEKFNDLTPTQKTLTIAATGLTAAVAVPALMNLSAAAKRLADGRAVRLSTSIRKRRNQDKDLVIGVQPLPGESEEVQPEQIAQPEESKGFLSKIFG